MMSSLGSAPPWAVLQSMIDKADSDRNGKVFKCLYSNIVYFYHFVIVRIFKLGGKQSLKYFQIDFPEFLMLMTGSDADNNRIDRTDEKELERRRKKREEELYDIFYLFDKDRSGYISDTELASVMMQFGHLSEADVHIMIAEADIDGDGQVK